MLTLAAAGHTRVLVIGIVFLVVSAGNLLGGWYRVRTGSTPRTERMPLGGPGRLRHLDTAMSVVGVIAGIVLIVSGAS